MANRPTRRTALVVGFSLMVLALVAVSASPAFDRGRVVGVDTDTAEGAGTDAAAGTDTAGSAGTDTAGGLEADQAAGRGGGDETADVDNDNGNGNDAFEGWVSGRWQGANIYQRRSGSYDGEGWEDRPVVPTYSGDDFNALAETGANLVVISHPGIFTETAPFHTDQVILDNLTRLVDLADQAGLKVVIAARTGPGRSEITFHRDLVGTLYEPSDLIETVWTSSQAQAAWVRMWEKTAEVFADDDTVIGYVLMVEPNASTVVGIENQEAFISANRDELVDWGQLQTMIGSAVRRVDRETPILIEPDGWADPDWLNSLPQPAFDNLVYSVHLYRPYSFVVEGRSSLSSDRAAARFSDDLGRAVESARSRQVPLAVLEYGVNENQSGAADYLAEVLDTLARAEVSSALWLWEPAANQGWPHDPLGLSSTTDPRDRRRLELQQAWRDDHRSNG